MKQKLFLYFTFFIVYLSQAQNLPFEVYLEPVNISGLIGVQSYSFGQANGKWLIVGGRLDGLHKAMGMGMMGTPFPESSNNNLFIVIDPVNAQFWTANNADLSEDLREQLSSTNAQYFQEGDYLYILGGYGHKSSDGKHKTFDKVSAINVPNTINSIINGNSFTSYIRQFTEPIFQVTGGQLEKIHDVYYLVGGHNFDGTYHHMGGMGMFTQAYTYAIRKFRMNDNGTSLTINHLPSVIDTANLRRRDFNLVQQILPNGDEGLTAFSGVFQQVADIPYLNCINIDSASYTVNNAFSQYYNHYQCANLPFYSAYQKEMFTVFFGGMSQYYDNSGVLTQDNNVPFVKTIACVKRDSFAHMVEYKLPVQMPALLGAGSEFIPLHSLPYYHNWVLKYDSLTQDTTLVGYIYGGINSPNPNVFSGGMGSNGLTSARHDVFNKLYAQKYPESYDNAIDSGVVYSGTCRLEDEIKIDESLSVKAGKLVLSPTRTYAPIIKKIIEKYSTKINGMVHCSGGGQTKILHFLNSSLSVIKDQLFEIPPLFNLIQKESGTDWHEMYKVFNMGHRMELYVNADIAEEIIAISKSFNVEAKIIGKVYKKVDGDARLTIISEKGTFTYD